jgi:hypothetical protein
MTVDTHLNGAPRMVPREQPDDRGLSQAMARAERAEAEALNKENLVAAERTEEDERTERATRTLFIDALYRAKALNGDAAFDLADLDDLDTSERMALRLGRRRRVRWGTPS